LQPRSSVRDRETSIPEAAQLMRRYHVGDLVVVDEIDGKRVPVGIVTDRDIVIEIISQSLDINEFKVGDIMSLQLISVQERKVYLKQFAYARQGNTPYSDY